MLGRIQASEDLELSGITRSLKEEVRFTNIQGSLPRNFKTAKYNGMDKQNHTG